MLIRLRKTLEDLFDVYAEKVTLDPTVVEFREFACRGCGMLLDVDEGIAEIFSG